MSMPLFTSTRERRLWVWTLVVVVAIYATLGLAPRLVGMLTDQDLAAVFFLLGMFLVGVSVLALALKTRPGGVEIGVALGITAVYLMVFFRITLATERSHLIEYSVVAALIYEALIERKKNGRRIPVPGMLAILMTALIGVIDECIQAFLPDRVFDPADILFNVLAGVMAVSASTALRWARRRRS